MTEAQILKYQEENLRRLERIESGVSAQRDKVSEVVAGQARVEGSIEKIEAVLESQTSRARDELTVLFGRTRDHGEKIGSILVDYVPERDFKAHQESNRQEHESFKTQIGSLTTKVASASAVGSFVGFLLGLLVQYFRK